MDQIFLHQFDVLLELRHFLSIILACLCGWAIGYERKSRNKQAGVKTHVIVALASALMMIVSKEAFWETPDAADTTRIAAQIVSGISFIGGGIIYMRDMRVSGVTTAAGLWATSGIGMAIGGGFWFFGSVCCSVVVIVQLLTHRKLSVHRKMYQLNITGMISHLNVIHDIHRHCNLKQYQAANVEVKKIPEGYELYIQIDNDARVFVQDFKKTIQEKGIDFKIKKVKFKATMG